MRFTVALLATLLLTHSAFADGSDRKDPLGDKLLTGGAAAFTVAYAPMTVTGTVYSIFTGGSPGNGIFFTPIGGPFFLAADAGRAYRGDTNMASLIGTLAVLDGLVQVGGITLMIAGGVHRHRVAARATPSLSLR